MNRFKIIFLTLVLSCSILLIGCEAILDSLLFSENLVDDGFKDDGSLDDFEENADDESDHTCIFSDWEIIYDSSCSMEGVKGRRCIECYETESCIIEKKDHTIVIDEAVSSTNGAPGKTEGKHCSVCGEIIQRQEYYYSDSYTDPSRYSSNYAYNYLLANYQNGSDMQEFYNLIDDNAEYFHSSSLDARSKVISETVIYFAAEVDYYSFGLTKNEAIAVWSAYRLDHPLYYWMSNLVSTTDKQLSLVIYEEYADADVRADYNAKLYDKVEDYITDLDGRGSEYQIALSFHDGIILSTDYAYEEDGITPLEDAFAHNVLGVMLFGEGVCESYTKAFQMLLNYCGVENIYVAGNAGGPHAWNLVKLDNGEWYWFDLTWNDVPGNNLGVKYSYFCVNDSDNVKSDGEGTFVHDHFPSEPEDYGTAFAYSIPDRGEESFSYSGPMLFDEVITINGLSYVICGSESCALVNIAAEGDVLIPETINFMGFTYTVAIIGNFEDGKIVSGPVVKAEGKNYETPKITSITIPKTVEIIWDYAFIHAKTVKSYIVDDESDVYASKDGVLFTKSLYTLIQYPLSADVSSYVVPSTTVEIAYGAFGDGGNVFYPMNLKVLEIGSSVEVYGAAHFGRGYRDSTTSEASEIVTIAGYFEKLEKIFGFGLIIKK